VKVINEQLLAYKKLKMLKTIYDKIVLMWAILLADRVVLITLKKGEFRKYLRGDEYKSTITFNSMVSDNANEIISNLGDNVDKNKILAARNNYWGLDVTDLISKSEESEYKKV
jgi:hypothetical protein